MLFFRVGKLAYYIICLNKQELPSNSKVQVPRESRASRGKVKAISNICFVSVFLKRGWTRGLWSRWAAAGQMLFNINIINIYEQTKNQPSTSTMDILNDAVN